MNENQDGTTIEFLQEEGIDSSENNMPMELVSIMNNSVDKPPPASAPHRIITDTGNIVETTVAPTNTKGNHLLYLALVIVARLKFIKELLCCRSSFMLKLYSYDTKNTTINYIKAEKKTRVNINISSHYYYYYTADFFLLFISTKLLKLNPNSSTRVLGLCHFFYYNNKKICFFLILGDVLHNTVPLGSLEMEVTDKEGRVFTRRYVQIDKGPASNCGK